LTGGTAARSLRRRFPRARSDGAGRRAAGAGRGGNASVIAISTLTVTAFAFMASDCIVTGACTTNVVHDAGDDPPACTE